jgi:hypothetical protein
MTERDNWETIASKLHNDLYTKTVSEFRLQKRVTELEAALKPFADKRSDGKYKYTLIVCDDCNNAYRVLRGEK